MGKISPEHLSQCLVLVQSGAHNGEKYTCEKKITRLGRGSDNDIILSKDQKVSREHLEIHLDVARAGKAKVRLINLSEKNYMLVNGESLREVEITSSTAVTVGDSSLLFIPSLGRESSPKANGVLSTSPIHAPMNSFGNSAIGSPEASPPAVESGFPPGPPPPSSDFVLSPGPRKERTSLLFFVGVILIGIILGSFLLKPGKEKRKNSSFSMRNGVQMEEEIAKSKEEVEQVLKERESKFKNTFQYEKAQEFYSKGFRDYMLGQYGRATESFTAALIAYPNHVLASKYRKLAENRQLKLAQTWMLIGKRYYGKRNFRLCQSSYERVLDIIKEDENPMRREALQFSKECGLLQEAK